MQNVTGSRKTESKKVRLGDYPFLRYLTGRGSTYQGASQDTVITVVAVEGHYGDWTAYFQTPSSGPCRVAELGDKLPLEVARMVFPDWARKRTWRY